MCARMCAHMSKHMSEHTSKHVSKHMSNHMSKHMCRHMSRHMSKRTRVCTSQSTRSGRRLSAHMPKHMSAPCLNACPSTCPNAKECDASTRTAQAEARAALTAAGKESKAEISRAPLFVFCLYRPSPTSWPLCGYERAGARDGRLGESVRTAQAQCTITRHVNARVRACGRARRTRSG